MASTGLAKRFIWVFKLLARPVSLSSSCHWHSLLRGHGSFLLAPGMPEVLSVPSKSLSWFCGSSVIKSLWLQSQILWGSSSARQPHGGANGNLLQEGLCHHTLRDPGLLQPEPLSLKQATADSCLLRRCPNIQTRSGSVSVGPLGPDTAQVLLEPSDGDQY